MDIKITEGTYSSPSGIFNKILNLLLEQFGNCRNCRNGLLYSALITILNRVKRRVSEHVYWGCIECSDPEALIFNSVMPKDFRQSVIDLLLKGTHSRIASVANSLGVDSL